MARRPGPAFAVGRFSLGTTLSLEWSFKARGGATSRQNENFFRFSISSWFESSRTCMN
jgi:hypothetical protein